MQNQKLKDFIRMQKVFLTIISVIASSLFVPALNVEAQDSFSCGSGNYVISAYYSPVPGQSRYATGSYEGDIRLNGGGVTTASGAKVADTASPFVAAPPCMPFGTELQIEGLGVHQVLDRGGAIKGNRLDIWMGYGDVGLKNALTWGKRTVFVAVDGNFTPTAGFSFDLGKGSLKSYQEVKVQDPFNFLRELAFGDTGEDVARLQQILKDLGYYRTSVTGSYDENTKLAVVEFEEDNGVLQGSDVSRTGRFGSTAIVKLRNAVITNREKFLGAPSRNLGRGSTGEDVKKLQQFLVSLGLMNEITGVYDALTVEAVTAFQLSQSVIASSSDQAAGYFGPATQIAFDRVALSLENFNSSVSPKPVVAQPMVELASEDMLVSSLEEGMDGPEVRKLQQILKDLGYLKIEANGYFGPITRNAVFKFQQKMQLVISETDSGAGFVGLETRNALNQYLTKKASLVSVIKPYEANLNVELAQADPVYEFTRLLVFGESSNEVKILQEFLKARGYFSGHMVTDYFGPVTKSALNQFKQDNGLSVDSDEIFDEATRLKINSLI